MGRALHCVPYGNGGCELSVDNNILIAGGAKFIVYSTKPFTGQHFSRYGMKHKAVQRFSV
jgi:hypothetical protein